MRHRTSRKAPTALQCSGVRGPDVSGSFSSTATAAALSARALEWRADCASAVILLLSLAARDMFAREDAGAASARRGQCKGSRRRRHEQLAQEGAVGERLRLRRRLVLPGFAPMLKLHFISVR